MNPDRIGHIKRIFDQAIELPLAGRSAFLDQACSGDDALRVAVTKLLAEDDERENSITTKPIETISPGGRPVLKNRYRIESELGRGGFGVVFIASDLVLHNRRVVVKAPTPTTGDRWARQKFENEIAALAKIHHPNVVAVIDSGDSPEGHPFFVMEFVEGVPLSKLIQPDGAPLRETAEILRQIGSALAACHAHNICHRDLKPENILIQDTGGGGRHVKLIDFGIASLATGELSGSTTKVVGSLPYMAPEQLEGRVNAFSDIYAVGVIAYELLTGKLPFEAAAAVELYKRQANGDFVRPSRHRAELPPEANDLICQALSFTPESRFASAREFTHTLADALIGVPSRRTLHVQRQALNAGRIVPKMCDRRTQEDDFKSFFLKSTAERPGVPQCVVVHGEEGSCHESLVERLVYAVDRISGTQNNHERPALRLRKVPWQYEGSQDSRNQRLLLWLFDQFAPTGANPPTDLSPGAFTALLARSQAHYLVLQHDIRAARWDNTGGSVVESYLGFLASLPVQTDAPKLLVFLNFIYPQLQRQTQPGIMTWVRSLPHNRLKSSVQKELARLESSHKTCPMLTLSELKPITRDDVMEWFSLHNIFDSEEKRLRASEWVFAATEGRAPLESRSMAEIEPRLQDLHRNHLAERGVL